MLLKIIFLTITVAVSVFARAKDVKLGFYEYSKIHEIGETGEKSGAGYEIFEKIAEKTDWTPQYVGYERSWNDMLAMLEKGEIDVLDFVHRTPEREKKFLFSAKPGGYSRALIMARKNETRFAFGCYDKWANPRIAYMAGERIGKELLDFSAANAFKMEAVPYPDEKSAATALAAGLVDLAAFDSLAAIDGFTIVGEFNPRPYYFCTGIENRALMDELDRAMRECVEDDLAWNNEILKRYYELPKITVYIPDVHHHDDVSIEYMMVMARHIGIVGGFEPEFVNCLADFSDVDLNRPCICAHVIRSVEQQYRFDFPFATICRRPINLVAHPENPRFVDGLPKSAGNVLKVGYHSDEKRWLECFKRFATNRGIAYHLYPVTSKHEMQSMVMTGELDCLVTGADADEHLRVVEECGSVLFDFAVPKGNSSLLKTLNDAECYIRYHEVDFLAEVEKRLYGFNGKRRRLVRVGAYIEPGNIELSIDREATGFIASYLKEIARRKDWDLVFVPITFPEAMNCLVSGDIDIVAAILYTEERAAQFNYSARDIGPQHYALKVRRDSTMLPNRPYGWKGAKIGCLTGAINNADLQDYLNSIGAECELVYYANIIDAEAAVRSGELNACYTLLSYSSSDLRTLFSCPSQLFYFGLNKRKPWLKEDLDSAMLTLAREDCDFETKLRDNFFPNAHRVLTLNAEELEFVREHRENGIKVAIPEMVLPICAYDGETGESKGFLPQLFRHFSEEIGLNFKFVDFDKDADFYLTQFGSIHDMDTLIIDREWFNLPSCLIRRKFGDIPLSARQVYAVEFKRYEEREYIARSGWRELLCESREECYKAVVEGRAEFTLDNIGTAQLMINRERDFKSLNYLRIDPTVYARKVCIAIPADADPRLRSIITKARNSISAADCDRILFDAVFSGREVMYTWEDLVHFGFSGLLVFLLIIILVLMISLNKVRHERQETSNARRQRDEELTLRFEIAQQKALLEEQKAQLENQKSQLETQKSQLENQQLRLEKAVDQANSASRAKTVFLNNMSHDIRTPMNAIIGYTGLASQHLGDRERVQSYLLKIEQASDHLLSLINEVLDMSRIESGKVVLALKPESLAEIVHGIGDIVATDVALHQHSFTIDIEKLRNPWIKCDKLRLNQVLINLCSNAIKYTKNGGEISLRVIEAESERAGFAKYEFRVKDNGIGMSEEFARTIFEPFTRESTSTLSGVVGTGLGMAITKNIVEMMGGTIALQTERGKGSEFVVAVEMEITEPPAASPTIPAVPAPSATTEASATAAEKDRILLVEDNEINLEITRTILEELGFKVATAENGRIAVEKVKASTYDLILMDIQMPEMDGYTATRAIRALGVKTPIIAMTANAFAEDRSVAIESGMNDHLAKPVKTGKLLTVISNYIQIPGNQGGTNPDSSANNS